MVTTPGPVDESKDEDSDDDVEMVTPKPASISYSINDVDTTMVDPYDASEPRPTEYPVCVCVCVCVYVCVYVCVDVGL